MKKAKLVWLIVLALSILYIMNLTGGIIELIPDNFPLYGNIDEGAFGLLIYHAIAELLKKR